MIKVELKNLQCCRAREGYAFSGDIWIDEKKAGEFSNSGTGGCDDFQFESKAARERFRKAVREWDGYHKDMIEPEDQFITFLMGTADE